MSNPTPRRPGPKPATNQDVITVDISVSAVALAGARVRLRLVNKAERKRHGTAVTTLSDIARHAILHWTAPTNRPQPVAPGQRKKFRFYMNRNTYQKRQAVLYAGGKSVASVVQDGLVYFARHGRMMHDPNG